MSSIHVITPGLLTTVQDLGRLGYGPLAVSASGAGDPIALRIGNRLLGNPENAAALEMTLTGGEFLFPDGAWFALTGADFGATLDGQAVDLWRTVKADRGRTLRLGATRDYARCYLCVAGGFAVKPFLGSASTHLLSGIGGFHGRALRKGDELQIGSPDSSPRKRAIRKAALEKLTPGKILRVTTGPQSSWFPHASRETFYSSPYTVAEESNRMGLRLQGAAVAPLHGCRMITEGVALGAIQIPDSGQPIILFVEQQTTGGYPKIANVISADLACLGQLRPRDAIRFEQVSLDEAHALLLEQENMLTSDDLFEEIV